MKIDVKRLAKLSRLEISESQIAGFEKDMEGIIQMVENLPEISDTGSLIDPETPMKMREDVSENKYRRDDLLKNAPQIQAAALLSPALWNKNGKEPNQWNSIR